MCERVFRVKRHTTCLCHTPLKTQEVQRQSPPLGAGVCAGVLLAMTEHQQWAHAYEVIKVSGRVTEKK